MPRIPRDALALLREHLDAQDLVVLTTATHRFITELTAAHFGVSHLLATEPEPEGGVFTGRATGALNMREGKVARLHASWRSAGWSCPACTAPPAAIRATTCRWMLPWRCIPMRPWPPSPPSAAGKSCISSRLAVSASEPQCCAHRWASFVTPAYETAPSVGWR